MIHTSQHFLLHKSTKAVSTVLDKYSGSSLKYINRAIKTAQNTSIEMVNATGNTSIEYIGIHTEEQFAKQQQKH